MPISLTYPKTVQFDDGSILELTDETWKQRHLLIVTDKSEKELRQIFHAEQFVESKVGEEIVKTNQLGFGLRKKIEIWQIHVRLFPHGEKYIAIDAEAELSHDYGIEHLTHGWISAFKATWDIILRRVGKMWVYHKKFDKYIVKIIKEETIRLEDPKTKTDPKLLVLSAIAVVLIGAAIASALKK